MLLLALILLACVPPRTAAFAARAASGCLRLDNGQYSYTDSVYPFVKEFATSKAFTLQLWTKRSENFDATPGGDNFGDSTIQILFLNLIFDPIPDYMLPGMYVGFGSVAVMGSWFDLIETQQYMTPAWVKLTYRFTEVDPALEITSGRFSVEIFANDIYLGIVTTINTIDPSNEMDFTLLANSTESRLSLGQEQSPKDSFGSNYINAWLDELSLWAAFLSDEEVTSTWNTYSVAASALPYSWSLDDRGEPLLTGGSISCGIATPPHTIGCAPIWAANARVSAYVLRGYSAAAIVLNATNDYTIIVLEAPVSGNTSINSVRAASGSTFKVSASSFAVEYTTTAPTTASILYMDKLSVNVTAGSAFALVTVSFYSIVDTLHLDDIEVDAYEGSNRTVQLTQHYRGHFCTNIILSLPEVGVLVDTCSDTVITSVPFTLTCVNVKYVSRSNVVGRSVSFKFTTRLQLNDSVTSDPVTVTIQLLAVNLSPENRIVSELMLSEDTAGFVTVDVADADSVPSIVLVGAEWLQHNVSVAAAAGRDAVPVPLAEADAKDREVSLMQWASQIVNSSNDSPATGQNSPANLLGETDSNTFRNQFLNSCTPLGSNDMVYTDFVRFKVATPVMPTNVYVREEPTPGRLVRIKARHPASGLWDSLWFQSTPEAVEATARVFSPATICHTPYVTDEYQIDFNACGITSFVGYDSVLVKGRTMNRWDLVRNGSVLKFTPRPNWNGQVNFTYEVTDCISDPYRRTVYTLSVTVAPVNDPPASFNESATLDNTAPLLARLAAADVDTARVALRLRSVPPNLYLTVNSTREALSVGSEFAPETLLALRLRRPELCGPSQEPLLLEYTTSEGNCSTCLSSNSVLRIVTVCSTCPEPFIYNVAAKSCVPCRAGTVYSEQGCVEVTSKLGIIIPSAICGVLIIAVISIIITVVIKRRLKDKFILKRFPPGTRAHDDVAIVFTDIEGSTKLWEALGDTMYSSLAIHNQIIRSAYARHGGREVKTIGDSFMIVFWTVKDAVKFMCDAQAMLTRGEWSDALLAAEGCGETKDSSGMILYRGLKVRMGCHAGVCEREIIKGTENVDYFGQAVNVAARIEGAARGGQNLISLQVASSDEVRAEFEMCIVDKGVTTLKGVRDTQHLFQVLPPELQERSFPDLRLGDPPKALESVCETCRRPCRHCLKAAGGHKRSLVESLSMSASEFLSNSFKLSPSINSPGVRRLRTQRDLKDEFAGSESAVSRTSPPNSSHELCAVTPYQPEDWLSLTDSEPTREGAA